MSSLAASRADGYYFPPDYDPAKHGSLNQFRGQHPLRERANKLDQGILVIRFEMPFNVWCSGCNHLIGKGVRFNAEKKQIGNYYSTKIWSFTMNAPCCGQKIEVQTDPKNTEYNVISGGRRKVETWTAESAETIELPEQEEQAFAPRVDDTIARLERGETDKEKAKELNLRVSELYHDSNTKFKNDYQLNRMLRKDNRERRGQEKELDKKRKALGLSEDVTLLPETEEDRFAASCIEFGDPKQYSRKWQQKRKAIKSQSIFTPSALTKLGHKWDTKLGQTWGELGQRWDSFCSNAVRRSSSEESAQLPQPDNSFATACQPVEKEMAINAKSLPIEDDIEMDSRASTQTDDETIKSGATADVSLANTALNEAWPQEPIKCGRVEPDSNIWVCKREVKPKLWKCPLNTVPEDKEMDCSQMMRGKVLEGQKSMRKLDKAKCRAQLSCSSGNAAKRTIALSQCQQKLKKTTLSDKISSALRRR